MDECISHEEDNNIPTTTRVDGNPKLGAFFNKDGLLLRSYGWLVKNAIGIILLIHGLNSHARLTFLRHNVHIVGNDKVILKDGNNYYVYKDSWIEHFNKNGYSVYALDLEGHGLSDGWRNLSLNINKFDDLVHDVIQYLNIINDDLCLEDSDNNSRAICDKAKECTTLCNYDNGSNNDKCKRNVRCNNKRKRGKASKGPNNPQSNGKSWSSKEHTNNKCSSRPIYILGQSMGGNIALRTLQVLEKTQNNGRGRLNIQGCISLSSMICFQKIASPRSYKYKIFYLPFTRLIGSLFPTLRLATKIGFQKYPYLNELKKYDKIGSKIGLTLKYWCELVKATSNLEKDMRYMPKDIPILFIHSKEDIFCLYRGVVSFFNRLDNDNKELISLDNMEHGLTTEPGNEMVLENIVNWIKKLKTKKQMAKSLKNK
ncbi:lysophospholipase, putative [Plasmodium knowlesi strain H]|uniref:Lysophospholipase, putative n=3 Tax=Plasmodium knowlesi TaxID=5850 RepID=A0A5K1U4I3_PLAKH|nr:lysophospholipase, putative [Plasmodium knowlesi strain H]OTN67385.1 putative Lysophospholipase [Plasmodium knowlesi]CAA9987641.1 lysophospholipase, putative [Plasmodium knowlesi strain H]SBO26955.1 lysophospholipase, putative [Plasmodium knowlesi strain H]SBO29278.1 lysophospholipase, putative [Plasmodium knowlesi strain H]VVS77115.1 lysophospholipase, putative [Plasmodium knowlesi strain H]|eukprot:XP_002258640.1 hypothetical protein, conserved in Plasmodium species [Plasmodium knowlesi strain H]